jgi:uncharacterized membrane protein
MHMSKESPNTVYHILAFVFADRNTALEVSKAIKSSAKPGGYKIIANAVVEVDDKGKPHVHEAGHGGWGTGAGLVAGGLLGLIGGPAGLLVWAVAGGAIGGIMGKYMGRAIPADDLKALAAQMQPNSSAILAMVEAKADEALIDEMKGYNAKVVTLTVGDELSGEIDQAVVAEVSGPADTAAPATPAAPAAEAPKSA